MLPQLMWLKQVDFVPLTYAGDTFSLTDRAQIDDLALGYVLHNLALLALPVVLGAIALGWRPFALDAVSGPGARRQCEREPVPGAQFWIIQAVVAIGPPLGAVIFHVYIKTDWGIPLFFLLPLALIAHSIGAGPENRAVEPDGDLAGDFARRAGGLAKDRRL